jgi:hypothetical protein
MRYACFAKAAQVTLLLSFPMQKSIPFKDIVGAVSEPNEGSLRIWFCEAQHSKGPGGTSKVVYKLKKSDRCVSLPMSMST